MGHGSPQADGPNQPNRRDKTRRPQRSHRGSHLAPHAAAPPACHPAAGQKDAASCAEVGAAHHSGPVTQANGGLHLRQKVEPSGPGPKGPEPRANAENEKTIGLHGASEGRAGGPEPNPRQRSEPSSQGRHSHPDRGIQNYLRTSCDKQATAAQRPANRTRTRSRRGSMQALTARN
jgi:hypothetical protein